jgi:hypothetical protein
MKTVFDPRARDELVARLQRLTADTKAKWGKFTATKMLVHANDAIRMNIGDLAVAPKPGPLRNAFMRWLMIYVAPWPKGVPTAPELLARGKNDAVQFEVERATFTQLLAKAAARQGAAAWPDHPAFGSMRGKDVGALMHKHVDHHWRQFGL